MKTSIKVIIRRIILISSFFVPQFIQAAIRLPKIIGSNMVLQREQVIPVWGWDSPGQSVTVQFSGQEKTAKADDSGYWKVLLAPLKASSAPVAMQIRGSEVVTLNNILVGEVWLCSGQSNMEYPMKSNYAKPVRSADSLALELNSVYPAIRLFKVEKVLSSPDVTSSGWNECSGPALASFSAAGYYFAREIHRKLGVPVGVIQSAWGGSRIEPWTPAEAYTFLPAFKDDAAKQPLQISGVTPGKNYQSMILPLAPFAIRGFLWYQGESNCMIEDGMKYADKMQALVDGWRNVWGNKSLPFYSVLIAPYLYTQRKDPLPHTPELLAEFWEAQAASLAIPNTGMVTVTDLVDNLSDIHPPYKWEVGKRLSRLALENDYGYKNVVKSGPVFMKMKRSGNTLQLTFDYAAGLKSTDGKELSWFTIAGSEGKFVPATAVITGEKIVVSAPGISKPVQVRFAWNERAQPNLANNDGLPAVPFRSDALTWKPAKK